MGPLKLSEQPLGLARRDRQLEPSPHCGLLTKHLQLLLASDEIVRVGSYFFSTRVIFAGTRLNRPNRLFNSPTVFGRENFSEAILRDLLPNCSTKP